MHQFGQLLRLYRDTRSAKQQNSTTFSLAYSCVMMRSGYRRLLENIPYNSEAAKTPGLFKRILHISIFTNQVTKTLPFVSLLHFSFYYYYYYLFFVFKPFGVKETA